MRIVLKKIQQQKPLDAKEYAALSDYVDELRWNSPESYLHFFNLYADHLARNYAIYLPQFRYGRDDFFDYLLQNPEIINHLPNQILVAETFPLYLHEYLLYKYGSIINLESILALQALLRRNSADPPLLPIPRQKNPVFKYEDSNPYKEAGLKNHFEKIGRYSFVSRIQSYRYLRGNKTAMDKIEVISPDCLGGIFTNKEKSIYYYIFLTEENYLKATNACQVLNSSLYGK